MQTSPDMKPVLDIQGLWKSYRLGTPQPGYLSLRDRIMDGWKRRPKPEPFWALSDVSFSLQPGETAGIIGRNGAGKSTLLKILSRITPPTRGHVAVRGRVASLLEVGTGFHPELTGRENIYLNGAILGMKRAEIERRFDEIVDFSGVERFLDTSLKHYSSGMQLRLAFAVAAHLEPEILLIDEVLAVGDAAFQKKCIGKMNEVSRSGRTILFVSHNMGAVAQLCTTGIFLENGQVAFQGSIEHAIQQYMDQVSDAALSWEGVHAPTDFIRIENIRLLHPEPDMPVDTGMELTVELEFELLRPVENVSFELWCRYEDGTLLFCSYTHLLQLPAHARQARCRIPAGLLNEGYHSLDIGLSSDYVYSLLKIDNALSFRVEKHVGPDDYPGKDPGVMRPLLRWDLDGQPVYPDIQYAQAP